MERLHRAASRAITGCLSSSPIPLLLTEASIPPLRVTLTHFTVLSYERALRLPTSFPISGLARLGVRPRLCRSSWRAFASTHPLMLPSICSREALVACPPFPPWNLPSFTVESTLSSPCSRSDPPHSRQGAALAHLDSLPPHDLVLWTDGSVPFPFGKGGSGVLANCSVCGTEATLSFSAGQFVPVFPLKPAPFCTLFIGLGNTIKSAIFLLFFSCLTLVLSSPPCPLLHLSCYLKLCGRSGRNCPSSLPVLSGYNGFPDTRFSRGTTQLMSLPDGERYLRPPQSLVVSLLLSLVSTLVFSRTGGVLSLQKYFDTQVPSTSTEELVLPRHARCVLSRLRCNVHSLLLGSCLPRKGRIENSSCSACGHSSQDTSHLILHCPATDSLRRSLFGDSLSLYDLWSRPWGVSRLLGLHGLPPCPHPSEGVG